jgi:hypothetical protein
VETEVHRRARLLAVGESVAFSKDLHKLKGQLASTRSKFESVKAEMKSAATKADIALFNLNTVMEEARNIYGALQRERVANSKVQATTMEYNSLVVQNLRKQLKDTRKVANSYNSANAKLKSLRQKDKAAKNADRSKWPLSKLPGFVQHRVSALEMDAGKAMEDADGIWEEAASLRKENAELMGTLELCKDKLAAVVAECSKTSDVTDWIDLLGKKGEKYNMHIIEMGMQMMSSELSAAQAVFCLTVFMAKARPTLTPGVDYRIPGESVFKEWGEAMHGVVTELNRSRLDEALIIHYKHDDSPRNGLSYHGMHSECVFEDDGDRFQEHVPLGLELLADGKHQHQADKGVETLGENMPKMPAVMSDNAATDVATKMHVEKVKVCAILRDQDDDFTEEQLEVMATNFVDACITHGGDLASTKHHNAMEAAIKDVIISYNCATLIQKMGAHWLLRRSLRRKEVRLNLLVKAWGGTLGHSRCHTPMKLASKMTDDGKVVKCWELTEVVPSVYSLMCSMSNLISNQGQHSNYYLNESKDFRLFWVRPCVVSCFHSYESR